MNIEEHEEYLTALKKLPEESDIPYKLGAHYPCTSEDYLSDYIEGYERLIHDLKTSPYPFSYGVYGEINKPTNNH